MLHIDLVDDAEEDACITCPGCWALVELDNGRCPRCGCAPAEEAAAQATAAAPAASSTARSGDEEVVAQFAAVTHTALWVAMVYLETTDFQLQPALDLFFAAPRPGGAGAADAGAEAAAEVAAAAAAAEAAGGAAPPRGARRRRLAPGSSTAPAKRRANEAGPEGERPAGRGRGRRRPQVAGPGPQESGPDGARGAGRGRGQAPRRGRGRRKAQAGEAGALALPQLRAPRKERKKGPIKRGFPGFERSLGRLRAWLELRGCLPWDRSDDKEERQLAAWVTKVRAAHSEGRFSSAQAARLEALEGWRWGEAAGGAAAGGSAEPAGPAGHLTEEAAEEGRLQQRLQLAIQLLATDLLRQPDANERRARLRQWQRTYHPDKNPGRAHEVLPIFRWVQSRWDQEFRSAEAAPGAAEASSGVQEKKCAGADDQAGTPGAQEVASAAVMDVRQVRWRCLRKTPPAPAPA